jgi:hypothetical protein
MRMRAEKNGPAFCYRRTLDSRRAFLRRRALNIQVRPRQHHTGFTFRAEPITVHGRFFDIGEMAPTSYLMAVAAGAPLTALALPMTRRFRRAGTQRLRSSTIRNPKDLERPRAGVRTYSVTAAVWTHGIFADEYGVEFDKVRWQSQEGVHVAEYTDPDFVTRIDLHGSSTYRTCTRPAIIRAAVHRTTTG